MSRVLVVLIDSIIMAYAFLYVSSKIVSQKLEYKNLHFWIALLIETGYLTVSYLSTDSFIRVIINLLILVLINIYFYKLNIVSSSITAFITLFVGTISEIIFMLLLVLVFHLDAEQMQESYFGAFSINFSIALINILLINVKPLRNFFSKIIQNLKLKENLKVLFYCLLSFSCLALLLYYIYFETDMLFAGFLCFILVITFALLTLYLVKEKDEHYKLQIEYDILENNLEEYEKMYQKERMRNHEFKNELSTVKGLVNKKDKKLLNYLDELLESKKVTQAKWMDSLKKIPEPTLRGLLYYKFSLMEHEKIKIDFEISREVDSHKFHSIDSKLYKKSCRILGVYLDNAIQAVVNLEEKTIRFEIYLEKDFLVFSIMNPFFGNIEMSKLGIKGYSTKGNGRGLGLAMVKEVLEQEESFCSETQIIKHYFLQKLKIQLKK